MTFFYDLNKKIAELSKPREQLTEGTVAEKISPPIKTDPSERGKYKGKDIGDLKSMKAAHLKQTAAQREAGKPVSQADKEKTAELNFAIRAKQAHGGKWGKIKEADMEEGNRFTYNLKKARDAGKTRADLDGDGDMEPVREAAKPDYIDLDKDGNRRESMKKAAADKKRGRHEEELDEGWEDMMKDVARRGGEMKRGEKMQGHKGEIEKTDTGIRHTRRYDAKTGETDVGDDEHKDEKRGRGRPKGSKKAMGAKGPTGKSKLMTKEEIEEAIAALEEAGYMVQERELKPEEKSEKERVFKKHMKPQMAAFKKRYGERGEEVAHAVATNIAKGVKMGKKKKEESVEETTVAGSMAPATEAPKSKAKGGMTFGKGIYDSLNRDLEAMISESMNVSVNMSMDEHGEPRKNITVSAEGQAAEQLAQLLNLAGIAGKGGDHEDHSDCGCGTSPCSCEEMVDENAPDYPTNTAVIGDDDPHLRRFAGGLNRPKSSGQTTVPVVSRDPSRGAEGPEEMHKKLGEANELGMNLYREYKNYKAKQ